MAGAAGFEPANVDSKNRCSTKIAMPNGGIINSNNILKLENCLTDWCYISHIEISGWISKDYIWGVYKDEIYNQIFYQPIINQYWKFLESKFLKN